MKGLWLWTGIGYILRHLAIDFDKVEQDLQHHLLQHKQNMTLLSHKHPHVQAIELLFLILIGSWLVIYRVYQNDWSVLEVDYIHKYGEKTYKY